MMIKTIFKRIAEVRKDESGVTISEIMVSFIIIMGILLATAFAMGQGLNAQATGEARDRAVQLANGIIEEAKQVPYDQLGVTQALYNADQVEGGMGGDVAGAPLTRNGEKISVLPAGKTTTFRPLPYEERFVGQNDYELFTYITEVRPKDFDGAYRDPTASDYIAPNAISAKRITVIVNWQSDVGTQRVAQTMILPADTNECIPPRVLAAGQTPPAECAKTS